MISEIRFSGFQGFASDRLHTAKLAPLTLVFGPNASGKSSLLRAAKLIHQSVDGSSDIPSNRGAKFRFEGEQVSLASFANCSYMHEVHKSTLMTIGASYKLEGAGSPEPFRNFFDEVSLTWQLADPGWVKFVTVEFKPSTFDSEGLKIEFRMDTADGRDVTVTDIQGDFSQLHQLVDHPSIARMKPDEPKLFRKDTPEHEAFQDDFYSEMNNLKYDEFWKEVISESREFELGGVLPYVRRSSDRGLENFAQGSFETDLRGIAKQFAMRILGALLQAARSVSRRASSGLISVAPLRAISERLSFQQSPTNSGQDVELERSEAYEQKISNWLEELTDGRFSYKRAVFVPEEMSIFGALESPQVIDNQSGTSVSFMDVGVGLSQVLPILEALALRNMTGGATRTLFVEQPELHLHPKMQASLADLFIDSVNARRLQIVAETHSEALLNRVQKRLREGKLSPQDVQVIYVEPGASRASGYQTPEGLDTADVPRPQTTNTIRQLPLLAEEEYEIEFPVSFAGLRLSEYL